MKNIVLHGDCLKKLKEMESESVDCIVTSPPYWALRDYNVEGQIGLEKTPEEYINRLCDIFDEIKRVLKKEGTCWVNIGDTYGGTGDKKTDVDPKYPKGRNGQVTARNKTMPKKSLCQIPSHFAIEMCNRGWILRNEIIWYKPNAMPSSAKDRFTVDFEKVFFFVKNKKYYFNTQYEPYTEPMNRWGGKKLKAVGESSWDKGTGQETYRTRNMRPDDRGKIKRCIWKIPTKPYNEAHFATYPEKLIEPMIDAGCPRGGIVLDPFFGAGTTGLVALKQGKQYIGIELNKEYITIAQKRLNESMI